MKEQLTVRPASDWPMLIWKPWAVYFWFFKECQLMFTLLEAAFMFWKISVRNKEFFSQEPEFSISTKVCSVTHALMINLTNISGCPASFQIFNFLFSGTQRNNWQSSQFTISQMQYWDWNLWNGRHPCRRSKRAWKAKTKYEWLYYLSSKIHLMK